MGQIGFLKILSLGTLFLILSLVTLSVPSPKTNQQTKAPSVPTGTTKPATGAHLKFSPNLMTGVGGDTLNIGIIIDTQDKKIVATDLMINFDPAKIKIIDAKAGEFFSEPVILNKEIDNTRGKLALSIGAGLQTKQSLKQGTGRIALLKVELKKMALPTSPTVLYFDPKTIVAALSEDKSVLISSDQLKITILP